MPTCEPTPRLFANSRRRPRSRQQNGSRTTPRTSTIINSNPKFLVSTIPFRTMRMCHVASSYWGSSSLAWFWLVAHRHLANGRRILRLCPIQTRPWPNPSSSPRPKLQRPLRRRRQRLPPHPRQRRPRPHPPRPPRLVDSPTLGFRWIAGAVPTVTEHRNVSPPKPRRDIPSRSATPI